ENALEGAQRFSQSTMIGRLHFAYFLVQQGYAKDIKHAFKKFLINNKPGYIKDTWASLEDVINWIQAAKGIAIIAHPARYKLKLKKLKQLVNDFCNLGGQAIEVVSGSQCVDEIPKLSKIAEEYNLYASIGSDFHSPDMPWNNLGYFPDLPRSCKPVSELLT
ncbi:MAG: phosphatase, partial [Gammaproteobacteria bacterium]|nr:phosphatase [Gammaproteobacteria bacterium]